MIGAAGKTIQRLARKWAVRRIDKLTMVEPGQTLRLLLRAARATRFGKSHGFAELARMVDPYPAFRDRIPIMDYSDWISWLGPHGFTSELEAHPLSELAWPGKIDSFCLSSGTTTGRTKFIPYSRQMASVNRTAAIDFFAQILAHFPELAPPGRVTLYMSGSTNLARNKQGALCGDMSALTKFLAPAFLQKLTLPPAEISRLEPWTRRLEALSGLCIRDPRIGVISGIPIWQLTLLKHIRDTTGRSIPEVMPNLRCLIHGGMSMAPYREQIQAIVGPDVLLLETYAASETGITAFQRPGEEGMRFWTGYRVFYEFEAQDGSVFTIDEIEAGVRYGLIVTSCAGLWRYRIGDQVVFRSTDPPILDYVTRDKTMSAFDEKMTEKELEIAMADMEPRLQDFAVGPDLTARRHVWFLIADRAPEPAWLKSLDDRLRANNQDYDDYRADGRIAAPSMLALADRAGFFETIKRKEGGQSKFPRLLTPGEVHALQLRFSPRATSDGHARHG